MKKIISYAAMAVALCACSNNDVTTPEIIDPQSATLSISTSVSNSIALTRTIGTEGNLSDATGTGPVMGTGLATGSQIGVFVYKKGENTDYDGTAANDDHTNLLWTNNSNRWSFNGNYYLGNSEADIYAYFPYKQANNTQIIPVTPGYTDFLYGKSSNTVHLGNKGANIVLNHALSMVTFTFENTGYTGPTVLQSITLNQLPNSGTLDITTGVTTIQEPALPNFLQIKKYTGASYIEAGHIDAKPENSWATSFNTNKIEGTTASGNTTTAGMFHAMVLPEPKASVEKHTATIVIDGVSHEISLRVGQRVPNTPQAFIADWEKGKNYTYNLKLSGNNQLTVDTVTVNQWQEGGSSDIEI